jgi:altronate dehydratase large subunit
MTQEFFGFQRQDGRIGIRNYVGVISAMDSVNPIAAKIVDAVRGTILITDLFGRKLAGFNHQIRFEALSGLGKNPNIGSAIVVSLHRASAMPLAEAIAQSGKDVEFLAFQDLGSTLTCIEHGMRLAVKMVKQCTEENRQPFPLACLQIGVECGGSDFSSGISGNPAVGNASDRVLENGGTVVLSETPEIIGAEHILAKRAVNQKVAKKLLHSVQKMEALAKQAGFSDIRASNPSADNIKGGLTTLAEKSLGAILKAGTKPLNGVLEYAEKIPQPPGFYFMNTPAPACESLTGLAAGGVQLVVFNTGLGNPISNPVTPTIKVSGNPHTAKKSTDDLDLDVSAIITKGLSIEKAGETVFKEMVKVANGKMTFSEIVQMTQSTISVIGPSV